MKAHTSAGSQQTSGNVPTNGCTSGHQGRIRHPDVCHLLALTLRGCSVHSLPSCQPTSYGGQTTCPPRMSKATTTFAPCRLPMKWKSGSGTRRLNAQQRVHGGQPTRIKQDNTIYVPLQCFQNNKHSCMCDPNFFPAILGCFLKTKPTREP